MTVSDAVSPETGSVIASPAVLSSVDERTGDFTSDWCPPSTVPELVTSTGDSGIEDEASGNYALKKPVWNKPLKGVVEAVSPVMAAVCWPALGESAKGSPKSSSSESLKALVDGPLLATLQVVADNSSPSSHKQTTPDSADPTAQNHNTSEKPGTPSVESSPTDSTQTKSQRRGLGSQSHKVHDSYQHQRNTYRRSNSEQHSRGDGSYNHNYGGKQDQDLEWNRHSRSFNGRDTHMHSPRGYPRGYMRPSVHTPLPFVPPQMPLVRSFGNNMMHPDLPSPLLYGQGPPPPPELLRVMPPLVGPILPPMYFVSDPMLHARIVSQIDYYFSNENLVKDTYLRKNMDEQGWVPVSLIAGFKKVLYLIDNVQLILDSMSASTIVEVQGDKIRRRNDWTRWLMQPPAQAVGSSPKHDALASQFQRVTMDDAPVTNQDSVQTFFGSGEFSSQLQQAGGEDTGGQQATLTRNFAST